MIDLKGFRKSNKLSQLQVAEFLGVSRSFVGQVEAGFSKLPSDKVSKLLANEQGWDVTYLMLEDRQHVGDNYFQNGGHGNIGKITGEAGELLALQKENELLRKQVEDLKAQNEKYWAMIEKLTAK